MLQVLFDIALRSIFAAALCGLNGCMHASLNTFKDMCAQHAYNFQEIIMKL
jgi:hypothetical protein